jgi:hypothetical protein
MYTLFLSHLTTSISQIDIFIAKRPTGRERVVNFADFKKLADKGFDSLTKSRKKCIKKHGGKGKTMKMSDNRFKDAMDVSIVNGTSEGCNDAECIMNDLGWKIQNYYWQWSFVTGLMSIKDFDQANRIAYNDAERMLVMSGLTWNHQSKAKDRDWINVVGAVTVELMLVGSYRLPLLMSCRGACALREEILAHMRSIATVVTVDHPITGQIVKMVAWDFSDGIPTPLCNSGANDVPIYNADTMRKDFDRLSSSQQSNKAKANNDPVSKAIDSLVKNKFLWTSKNGVSPGTLETLAYRSIANLWKASRSFVPRSFAHPSPRRFADNAFQQSNGES